MRYLLMLLVIVAASAQGQILNQDASGKSSIIWGGSSINIDAGESLVKINHYKSNNNGLLWGFDLQAKNENGFAALFKSGELNSKSEGSFLIGKRTVTFDARPDPSARVAEAARLLPEVRNEFETELSRLVVGCDDDETKKVIADLKRLELRGWQNAITNMEAIRSGITTCTKLAGEIDLLIAAMRISVPLQQYLEARRLVTEIALTIADYVPNVSDAWYTRLSVSATEFKFDKGKKFATFEKRFIDTLRFGFGIEFGYTAQRRMNFFGISAGFRLTNNFSDLEDQEYTYAQDTTLGPGKLSKKETFTGYSGDYEVYTQFYLNIDYQRMIDLQESHYLLIGPYLRPQIGLNSEFAKNPWAMGLSANYVNGKSGTFLGGIYIQTDDVAGELEGTFKDHFRFGLNTRFALGSIFPSR